MYEIELRALVENFDEVKTRLDSLATPQNLNEREVTIFLFNPHKPDFDLRLRLKKEKYSLNFKEGIEKTARKEIETEVLNPEALFELLLNSGFEIKMIVARTKYNYKSGDFNILLNRVLDWGDAVEVECEVEDDSEAEAINNKIEDFIKKEIGLPNLLSKEKMLEMNENYRQQIDFGKIKILDLLGYINDKKEIKFLA